MSFVTIHLIRHGAHDEVGRVLSGRSDISLSAEGRAQAESLGRRFASSDLAALYSSPVARARQTAEAITEAGGPPATVDELLDEIDFGDWAGLSFLELDERPGWRAWNEDRGRRRPPGGESMQEAQSRIARWLDLVRERHAGSTIAAVSHADVIKAAVAYALGLPLHFHDRFDIDPGADTTLKAHERGCTVIRVNGAC